MKAKNIFIGVLVACLVVVAAVLGVSLLLDSGDAVDMGSIHTTAAETQTTEAASEAFTVTAAETTAADAETPAAGGSVSEKPAVSETTAARKKETTAAVPQYKVSMEEKTFGNGNVTIEYPVVSGMEDAALQETINRNLSGNATSIISLYPVNTQTDQLAVKCKLNYIDRRRVSVIYTGTLTRPAQSQTAQTESSAAGSGLQLAPGETWAPPGDANTSQPDLSPGAETTQAQPAPGETIAGSSASGETQTIRVFYTNTVNLRTGKSMSLRDFVEPTTLGGYVLDASCRFEGADEKTLSYIRVYLSAHDSGYYASVFQNADFPLKGNTWPQSFCYENKGDIVFSVPVSNALGDYVLARYVPKTK